MNTRSKTNYENNAPYSVDIDFNDASESWKSNKKSKGNGCYTYICGQILKNGKPCMREPGVDCETCSYHKKK
jgi:hypothetical protein